MPVSTITTVVCDRCRRVIPSGYLWPYTFGPDGPLQVTGEICADLPNSCKELIQSVFWGTAQVNGPAADAFPGHSPTPPPQAGVNPAPGRPVV